MDRARHWNERYSTTPIERLGWYRTHLERSLAWIDELDPARSASVIDVGAGASTLVDDLLERGYSELAALDVSEEALAIARARLGDNAQRVAWHIGDVTAADLPAAAFDLWHDRAVFHFLTEEKDRDCYRQALRQALRPSGYLLIGTFSPDAPPRCSGLPVRRYDLARLEAEFASEFELLKDSRDMHVTPGGVEQPYVYALFRRRGRQTR
ncbi:MAG: class I SAM-dependent methyltransferase [Woeseiaceae bacterium]|nr:class I SAM-dependent methyltransferase [Woeseiaceae bacterium]